MAQTLQTLSVISFVIAGACLVLAVFFWLFFKIPTVIGDLSGRTAKIYCEDARSERKNWH